MCFWGKKAGREKQRTLFVAWSKTVISEVKLGNCTSPIRSTTGPAPRLTLPAMREEHAEELRLLREAEASAASEAQARLDQELLASRDEAGRLREALEEAQQQRLEEAEAAEAASAAAAESPSPTSSSMLKSLQVALEGARAELASVREELESAAEVKRELRERVAHWVAPSRKETTLSNKK